MKKITPFLLMLLMMVSASLLAQQQRTSAHELTFPTEKESAVTPEISFDPEELIETHAYPGQITTRQLTIFNTGTSPLSFFIDFMYGNSSWGKNSAIQICKDEQPFSLAKSAPGGTSAFPTDNTVIRHDNGMNEQGIGLTAGGTFNVSAYFTAAFLVPYQGMKLNAVEVYVADETTAFTINIYGQGNATNPGSLILSQSLTPVPNSWNMVTLATPVDVGFQDLWIGYQVTHSSGKLPAGVDAGPAVAGFGDMISLTGGSYESMSQSYGLNYNWNIAGHLIPGQQFAIDAGIEEIVSPSTGPHLNYEPVIIKIKTYGTQALSNIPWEVSWSGGGSGSYSGVFAGPLAPGASVDITAGMVFLNYDTYLFEACTNLPGDEYPPNNCKTKVVMSFGPLLCVNDLYSVGCDEGDGLTSWNMANINLAIPCTGDPSYHHYYADQFHQIQKGQTYLLTVIAGHAETFFDVWIDFDNNWEYNNGYELVLNDAFCEFEEIPYSFEITIPPDVPNGERWLRFRTNRQVPVYNDCVTYTYGNCADFKVSVTDYSGWGWIATEPANGVVLPGGSQVIDVTFNSIGVPFPSVFDGDLIIYSNAAGSPHFVPATLLYQGAPAIAIDPMEVKFYWSGGSQILTKTVMIINEGSDVLTYEIEVWQSPGAGPDVIVDPEFVAEQYALREAMQGKSNNEPTLNALPIIPDSLKFLTSNSQSSTISGVQLKNIEKSGLCVDNLYTTGCSYGDGLTSWNLQNITIPNIPCSGTPPWYRDYLDKIHQLEPGEAYVLTVTAGYADTYFDVWIDFDNDLEFNNNNELVLNDAICAVAGTVYTFNITIPPDAPAETFAMRARTNWTAPVTGACDTYTYGNCLDFKTEIGGSIQPGWLSAMPLFGALDPGASAPITVTFDGNNFGSGIGIGLIIFSSNDPLNPVVNVPVTVYPGCPYPFPKNLDLEIIYGDTTFVTVTWELNVLQQIKRPTDDIAISASAQQEMSRELLGFSILRDNILIAWLIQGFFYTDTIISYYPACYQVMAHYDDCTIVSEEMVCIPVSVAETADETEIKVYPNPARDLLHIAAPGIKEVSIQTISGKLVYNQMADKDNLQINTITYSKGIYIITIRTEQTTYTEKLIIQ